MDAIKQQRWQDLEGLSERERALCDVAFKLSGTPTKMVKGDWDQLRELGLTDRGCLEVAHVVGVFNHLTRLADGFGIALDESILQAAESGKALQRPADPRRDDR